MHVQKHICIEKRPSEGGTNQASWSLMDFGLPGGFSHRGCLSPSVLPLVRFLFCHQRSYIAKNIAGDSKRFLGNSSTDVRRTIEIQLFSARWC